MRRAILIVLHALLGVMAVAAGISLSADPTGGSLGFDLAWLGGSPFADFRMPGFFLAVVIGISNLVSALALWRRTAWASGASLATGALLIVWILVQTHFIGLRDWSQYVWMVTFLLVTALAALEFLGER